ncbi:MAG: RluA family pseudouridine synthase [Parachlamydiaceae bacterium]|nr:RluA family pseudouridine synthase [Parachlamydiaceae bacterium]
MEEGELLVVQDEEAGERLDKILARRFDGIKSRTYFQMLIEEGHVLLNGLSAKKRIKPTAGDEIQVNFVLTPEIGLSPEAIPLDIIFEDEHIIAINKPVGMVVHPAVGNWTGTFVNALLYHCQQLGLSLPESSPLRPGIVHRLDKDTSGLLLAAKTPLAHQRLVAMFSERKIHKEYLAVCLGNPGNLTISAPIGRHPVHRKLMSVVETGKPAISHLKALEVKEKISLVRVILETGRTHQIRVHFKHRGTPILGDAVYGSESANREYGIHRQLLHAHRLQFMHPIHNTPVELTAPIPSDLKAFFPKV